ncbi:MAG: hypothetical protein RLZ98_417 [Pseudomonadota bacterium]|jgi:DNA-nicking Smr family endonuclease
MKKLKGRVPRKPAPPQSAGSSGNDRRRKIQLSPDDCRVWEQVARTVEPIDGKRRVPERAAAAAVGTVRVDSATSQTVAARKPAGKRQASALPRTALGTRTPDARSASTPDNGIDRRKARRLARGTIAIDARIDLHGMRQSEAHDALRTFIARSSAAGYRHVLVITGKGQRVIDAEGHILSERREHGVLRRMVPEWLASDPVISSQVTNFATAANRHGGNGALYITLRSGSAPSSRRRD